MNRQHVDMVCICGAEWRVWLDNPSWEMIELHMGVCPRDGCVEYGRVKWHELAVQQFVNMG
jgi:hypothetical protein